MVQPHYICENCGTLFEGRARKYCTRKCRDAAYYKRKKERLNDNTSPRSIAR